MRTSATGRPTDRAAVAGARGFTLIEILVVIVIIAVMAGLLTISFSESPQRRLQREAADLVAVLNAAGEEAVTSGQELGLVIDEHGYHLVAFDIEKKRWRPLAGRRPHDFPRDYKVDVELDGKHLSDKERQRVLAFAARGDDTAQRPLLLMLSSGEMTPFTLTLSAGDDMQVTLEGDGVNPVAVKKG